MVKSLFSNKDINYIVSHVLLDFIVNQGNSSMFFFFYYYILLSAGQDNNNDIKISQKRIKTKKNHVNEKP